MFNFVLELGSSECTESETLYALLFLVSFIKFCPSLLSLRDQLRLLLALSGKTQTSLAIELDVSFVTFNRWFHGKAKARKSAQRRIEKLLLTETGLPDIPSGVLVAKKEILGRKSRESANVLQTILGNPDIHDEFVLTLTYNTNQIEGSTLTQEEPRLCCFKTARSRGKPWRSRSRRKTIRRPWNIFLAISGLVEAPTKG